MISKQTDDAVTERLESERRARPITHWVRWDDPGIRIRRALCGRLVPMREHSNDPTCPECAAALEAHEAATP